MSLPETLRAALADDLEMLIRLNDRELDRETLAGLVETGFPASMGLLPARESLAGPHVVLREAVAGLRGADGAALDTLAADFAAIYLTGAFGASPCESVWMDDDHLTCQAPMFELRKVYEAAGLANPDWRKRSDDHLVMQLDYLLHRLKKTPLAEDDAEHMAAFLDAHLLRWLPEFAARAAARCETPLYAGLVGLTAGWLETFRDVLASVLDTPRPVVRGLGLADGRRAAAEEPVSFVPGAAPSW